MAENDIPVLRGLADETANLPDLGKAIANLMSGGNYDLQQKLKQAIIQDPSVAENLSQLAKDNPQLYGSLKLGKLGNQIAQTPPGFKQKSEDLSLQRGQADLTETQARTTGLQNENDLAPVRKSIMDFQLKDLQAKSKQLDEQSKGFPGLKRPLGDIADDIMSGKNPPELGYIAGNPAIASTFKDVLNNKQQLRQIKAAADRQETTQQGLYDRLFMREDKQNEKKALDEGTQFVKRYNIGTPQTWAQWLSDPTTQNTVDNLVKNGLPPGQENDENLRNLRAIGVAIKQNRNIQLDAASRQNSMAADRILKEIKSGTTDRTNGLSTINQLLGENATNRGTRQIMMIPGDQVAGKSKLGGFIDRNKNVLVDAVTHEKLTDVGDDINDIDKYANQPATPQYTPQDLARAKAALPTASPKDLSDLQTKHPLLYQQLLPYIQQLEEQKKANKGTQ